MWFLYLFTWLSIIIQALFVVIAVFSALYYVAELIEEYSTHAKTMITYITLMVMVSYICLSLVEDFPLWMCLFGIASQIMHLMMLKTFPYVSLTSSYFLTAILLFVINHYLAFQFFSPSATILWTYSEIFAYFTICLWLVPFALVLSLSANDYVLPTVNERNSSDYLLADSKKDVVSKYFASKGKKYGLLSLFNYTKQQLLPSTRKKSF